MLFWKTLVSLSGKKHTKASFWPPRTTPTQVIVRGDNKEGENNKQGGSQATRQVDCIVNFSAPYVYCALVPGEKNRSFKSARPLQKALMLLLIQLLLLRNILVARRSAFHVAVWPGCIFGFRFPFSLARSVKASCKRAKVSSLVLAFQNTSVRTRECKYTYSVVYESIRDCRICATTFLNLWRFTSVEMSYKYSLAIHVRIVSRESFPIAAEQSFSAFFLEIATFRDH